jgi:hypothetical protein
MLRSVNLFEYRGSPGVRTVPEGTICANTGTPCECALDVGVPLLEGSRRYPPERRALLLPGTPSMMPPLPIHALADYYRLAIYTIHPRLLMLPQAVYWPGNLTPIEPTSPDPEPPYALRLPPRPPRDNGAQHPLSVVLERRRRGPVPSVGPDDPAMFALIFEEERFPGYFTDALVRCFLRGSLPLYWGDPALGELFDPSGIIEVDEASLGSTLDELRPERFHESRAAILENRNRALQWCDPVVTLLRDLWSRLPSIE